MLQIKSSDSELNILAIIFFKGEDNRVMQYGFGGNFFDTNSEFFFKDSCFFYLRNASCGNSATCAQIRRLAFLISAPLFDALAM